MVTALEALFVRRVLVVLGLTGALVLVTLIVWSGVSALLVTFAGVLLAVFLRGLACMAMRWTGIGQGLALAIVCIILLAVLGIGGLLLANPLQEQYATLIDELPKAVAQLRERVARIPLGQRVLTYVSQGGSGSTMTGTAATHVMAAFSTTLGVLGNVILILFVGLFLAAEPDLYRRGVLRLTPIGARPRAADVLDEIGDKLQRWLVGRIAVMGVVAVITWIGLVLLGVPLALALALLAGVLTFIPNFGPVLSAIPAMLLAMTQSPAHALYVGALYLSIQTVESYTLEPYVMRKADDLPPALVIASQLFLGVTLGALGLILATPLLVVIYVLMQRLYVEDVLGDALDAPESGRRASSLGRPSLTV